MKSLVCISHVPDTTTKIQYTADGKSLDKNGVTFIINPYDEFGLVRAIEFKEASGQGNITVLCVGNAEVEQTLRKALAIGADDAVRIDAEPLDGFFVAKQIAEYAKGKGFDFIFFGKESIDSNGSEVPGMVAEFLDLPFVSQAIHLTVDGGTAKLHRELDGGYESLESSLPCVVSCQKGISEWRIPNMRGIMMAKTKKLDVVAPAAVEPAVSTVKLVTPPAKGGCTYIDAEDAGKLVEILVDKGLISDMSVLLFAENANGKLRKAVLEAASYAAEFAGKLGVAVHAVSIGQVGADELARLGTYGVTKVHTITDSALNVFNDKAYARAIAEVAGAIGAKSVVMAQSYNGKAVAPRVAARLNAAMVSGASSNPQIDGDGLLISRGVNSGKGVETVRTHRPVSVITVKMNAYGLKENAVSAAVEAYAYASQPSDFASKSVEVVKTANKISITEADTVLSGGRGFKGPENWYLLEKIADLLGAGTACSKPVADMDWRPHHEHVGQTGIQIAPNLYIAIGISGAIQHLAGVNSSKNIVVINKDPEAPFFKIADYGIVGDLFEVLPKITAAIEKVKAAHA